MSDLFDLTFESGVLTGTPDSYGFAVTDGGDLSVTTVSAMGYGTYGTQCVLNDVNAMYGQKNQAAPASNEIRYRFYIDTNNLSFAVDPQSFIVLRHIVAGAPLLLMTVQLRYTGADNYHLRCHAYEDAGALALVDVNIHDVPHYVEIHIERASTNIASDGRVRLWVDGVLKKIWAAVDNFDVFGNMSRFRLGAPNGVDASITGTFYLDEFKANDDGGVIGPSVRVSTALQLLIDGVDREAQLIHETLVIDQTNDGLNSTCTFDLLDQAVIREDVWTVGLTHVTDDGHEITSHTTFYPQTKVEVRITDAAGTAVYFAGILSRVSATHMGQLEVMPGFAEPETQVLHCECQDFNQILEEMVIDDFREYGGIRDDELIDAIFDEFVFLFEPDIDYATYVTAVPYVFDIITFDSVTVRQALDSICAQSKGVWYVDYNKRLHYAADEAALVPAWHLSDLPDYVNSFAYFDDITKEKDATNLVNRVFVVCGTDLLPVSLWFIDQDSIDKYGSHRAIVRDTSLLDIDDIEAKGNAILEQFKDPIVTYVLKTYKGTPGGDDGVHPATDIIRAGQHIHLACAFYDLNETFLINSLVITFPVDGTPVFEITCGGLDSSASASAHRSDLDRINVPNITPSTLPIAARGWGHDLEFSSADDDTVEWTAGTITTADGQEFNIAPGDDTGDMGAVTYVYLDTGLSVTALQHSVNAIDAIGLGKILIAVCAPDTAADPTEAMYQVFGGGAGVTTFLHADNIATNCITANEIYGNTLAVIAANIGQLTMEAGGHILMVGAAGSMVIASTGLLLYDGPNPDVANVRLHLSTVDGKLTLKTATAGNARIEIDNLRVAGYDGLNELQFELRASDGRAYAGAGSVRLDADGLQIVSDGPVAPTERIKFLYDDAGTLRTLGTVYSDWAGGANPAATWLTSWRPVGAPWPVDNRIILAAIDAIAGTDVRLTLYSTGLCTLDAADLYCQWDLRVGKGLYVGSMGVDPPDNDCYVANDVRAGGGICAGNLGINPLAGEVRCTSDIRCGGGLYVGGTGVNPATGWITAVHAIVSNEKIRVGTYLEMGSSTYKLRRQGTHLEWYDGGAWVQLDNGPAP